MANIRIKDLSTDSALSAGDYVVVDSASEGSRKFDLGTELTSLKEDIGDLDDLNTDDKGNLVEAINWVLENGGGGSYTRYTITNTLSNVTTSNSATSIIENREYNAVLSVVEDATLDEVSVYMGGTDITSTAWNASTNAIHISSVTGDIIIMASAIIVTHTITNHLTNVTTSNDTSVIVEGKPYAATLTLAAGATLDSVAITMGGTDITATAWDATNMVISIASVSGDVVITARAYIVIEETITWSGTGSDKSTGDTFINSDFGDYDVYFEIPFVEGASQLSASATADGNAVKFRTTVVNDQATGIGSYYVDTEEIETSSRTSAQSPALKFNTRYRISPSEGLYQYKLWAFNNVSAFSSNSACTTYLNTYANKVWLVSRTEDEDEEETVLNAQRVDADLLRNYTLKAVSLNTETVEDPTTYEGVIETAKNAWMTEYGGSIDKIPLIIHTDQHDTMGDDASASMWETIDNMVSWYDISKVLNLGDTTNSYDNYDNPVLGDTALQAYVEKTEHIPWSKRIEVFGNHDCMKIIDASLTYVPHDPSYLSPYFKNVMARRTSNNGYFAICDPYFNVKYVVTSNYDYVDATHYEMSSPAQYDWLIEELTKNDGYDIIVLSHVGHPWYKDVQLSNILKARFSKTSGTATDRLGNTHTYDFTGCASNLLCFLHGHSHSDGYDYDMGVLSQCFDNYYDSTRPIFFVIVDRVNRQLKAWKVTNTPEYTTYTRPFDAPAT